jgi:gluconolactonase
MNDWHFELVAGPFGFTEGPVWDGEAVLFTDIPASRVMRYSPATGACDVYRTDTNQANGLALDRTGRLHACEGAGRRIVRYETDGSTTMVADQFGGRRLNSPNDLIFDSRDRIWFTDPRYGEKRDDMELDHESVFRVEPQADGPSTLRRVTVDTTRPNGLGLSPDERTLYVAQSEYGVDRKREVRAYHVQEDGRLGGYAVLHNFYPHRGIDGLCLDVEGNIIATAGWLESGPGPMIYVFAPSGRVLETHPLPADRPTNCCFGDADLASLYVTTGTGGLYRIRNTRHAGPRVR